ncbi:MAG: hypothetical protein FDZ75_02120 [Actinobacteria bacterium]|nr:MAG: hypothetical protein FDZ75_02120 [Actinomycetota bacterium]
MGGKAKAALVVAASMVAVLSAVGVATAAMTCTLKVEPGAARYGEEVVITPSINATAYPGDKFEIQQHLSTGAWEKWGEGLAVEETMSPDAAGNTAVEPLTILLDGTLKYPAELRAIYQPKSSKTASATSDAVALKLIRNTRTSVVPVVPAVAKHGALFTVGARVLPLCGQGRVAVVAKKVSGGGAYTRSFFITLDDEAQGNASLRLPTAGRYTVQMRFLGNKFGVASPVVSRTVVVR